MEDPKPGSFIDDPLVGRPSSIGKKKPVATVLSFAIDDVRPSRCYSMMVLDFGSATNDCQKVGSNNGQPVHLMWLQSIRANWAVCYSNNMEHYAARLVGIAAMVCK